MESNSCLHLLLIARLEDELFSNGLHGCQHLTACWHQLQPVRARL